MNPAELLELGTQPIRADQPAGDPGRDTPEFEALQTEVRKLEHPDQPNPDWKGVVASGTSLLRKSKDLTAASYLCIGLYETEGFAGLAAGLTVMRDMISGYWETMYPEKARLRGRAAAVEWLGERGAQRLRRPGARGGDAESLATCQTRVSEIGDLIDPLLESGSMLLRELRDALSEREQDMAAPTPAPAAATSSSAGLSSSAVAGPSSIGSPADLDRAIAEVRRLLTMMGDHLRANEPTHPLGYRAPRFAAWMAIRQVPPSEGGKTSIPPPQPADLAGKLEAALGAGQWAGVLQETEDRIGTSLYWFDLHRCAAQALEGLGHQAAADAVADELAGLLRRFPGLPDLQFADGTPVANSATRQWIATRVLAGKVDSAAVPEPASASAAPGNEEFQEVRREARELARKKRLPEALKLLEAGAARCGGLRPWVDWKLEVARLCVEHGHEATALAQLDAVDDRLRHSSVEDWDPATCVEVLKSLLLCRQKVLASRSIPEDAARSRELMSRLTRLDVVAAVEMNGRH